MENFCFISIFYPFPLIDWSIGGIGGKDGVEE